MKQLLLVIKLLFKDTYRLPQGEKKSGKIGVWVVLGIVYLLFEFALVTTIIEIAPAFAENGLTAKLLACISALGLTAVSAFGLMPMLNLLYFSKDAEFYASLPISTGKVYLAKLISVYLSQLAVTAAIALPALFAAGIVLKLGVLFYFTTLISVLFMPVIPLAVLSILCMPLMYLIGFLKNKGAISSIVAIVFTLAFIIVYMFFAAGSGGEELPISSLAGPVDRLSKVFYPLLAINRFALKESVFGLSIGASMLVNLLLFIGPVAVLFGAAILLSRFAYGRALTLQLENGRKGKSTIIYNERKSALKALIGKEWKEIIRNPVFTVQCFMGLIVMPVALIFIGLNSGHNEDASSACIMWFICVGIIQMMGSINIGASTTFSREGGAFYINKLLPLPYSTIIKAKIVFYDIIYSIGLTLSFVVWFIFSGAIAWWVGLMLYVYMLIANYANIVLCIIMDISKPKLDWKSYREIVKNSRNAILPALIAILPAIIVSGLAVLLFIILSEVISSVAIASIVVSALLIVIALTLAIVLRRILSLNARKYFERVEA